MLFTLVIFIVINLKCVLAETTTIKLSSVMFFPMNKVLAFEKSGTDAVVHFVMVYEDGVAYIPHLIRKAQDNQTSMFINKVPNYLFYWFL